MTTEQHSTPQSTPRTLRRRSDDRVIGGVASGLGDYLNVDPLLIRIGFVGLMVFGGMGLLLYIAAWLLVPDDTTDRSVVERLLGRAGLGSGILAVFLIIVGASVLFGVLDVGSVADRSGGVPALGVALVVIVIGAAILRRGEPGPAPAATTGEPATRRPPSHSASRGRAAFLHRSAVTSWERRWRPSVSSPWPSISPAPTSFSASSSDSHSA